MSQSLPAVSVGFVVPTDDVVMIRVDTATGPEVKVGRAFSHLLEDGEVALDSAVEVLRNAVGLFALVDENLVDVINFVVFRDAEPEIVVLAAR